MYNCLGIFKKYHFHEVYGPIVGLVVDGSRIRLFANANTETKIFALDRTGMRIPAEDVNATATFDRYIYINLNLVNDKWFMNTFSYSSDVVSKDYWCYVGNEENWTVFQVSDFGIDASDFGVPPPRRVGDFVSEQAYSADINRWGLFFKILPQLQGICQKLFRGAARDHRHKCHTEIGNTLHCVRR